MISPFAPWEYWNGENGEITYRGKRKHAADDTHNGLPYEEDVDEDEYIAWCATRNFFRSGIGVHPRVFVGALDIRGKAYEERKARFKKEDIKQDPDYITCPTGIFIPGRGPTLDFPWGINASFHANGNPEPVWIGNTYGPANKPNTAYSTSGGWFDWYRPEKDEEKPSQEDYDRNNYAVYF